MRIIAGKLGGRSFNSPHSRRIHPMSVKLRGAIFNALGDINGLSVLDAFAGSGAIGYEALSRGAKNVLAIDSDKLAQLTISANSLQLGLANSLKLIKARAGAWLSTSTLTFDIVICDPPYDDPQAELLIKLADRTKIDGLIILSLPPGANISLGEEFVLLSSKNYGDAELYFYRRHG